MSYRKERWVVRDFSENMADEVTKSKNLRRNKLAAFTRKKTHLSGLIDGDTGAAKLQEVFEELRTAYTILEEAHDAYACLVEENILDDEGDYLANPSDTLNSMDAKVSAKLKVIAEEEKVADKKKKIDRLKLKLTNSIESFGSPSKQFTEWSTEKNISCEDMRKELIKVEGWYETVYGEKQDLLNEETTEDTKLGWV